MLWENRELQVLQFPTSRRDAYATWATSRDHHTWIGRPHLRMHVQHSVLSLLLLVESAAVSNRRGVPDDSANTITYDTVHLIAHASKHIKQCVDLNELEGQLSNREHATVTWSSAAMCGDPAGTAQAQCVRSIRLFVLHQLSIMALDLAKTRFCCVAMDELARELDRLLHVPTLSRVHVAAGRAARAARSVANAATAATPRPVS